MNVSDTFVTALFLFTGAMNQSLYCTGLIHELKELKKKGKVKGYVGFSPVNEKRPR